MNEKAVIYIMQPSRAAFPTSDDYFSICLISKYNSSLMAVLASPSSIDTVPETLPASQSVSSMLASLFMSLSPLISSRSPLARDSPYLLPQSVDLISLPLTFLKSCVRLCRPFSPPAPVRLNPSPSLLDERGVLSHSRSATDRIAPRWS